MKDYSKMSDFEINNSVALSLGIEVVEWSGKIFGCVERKIDNVTSVIGVIDCCNNQSDAWPVIHENRISLRPDDMYEEAQNSGYWRADNEAGNHCHHENPLRAAMIVYLMMKDSE
jgi:hypothetical protein